MPRLITRRALSIRPYPAGLRQRERRRGVDRIPAAVHASQIQRCFGSHVVLRRLQAELDGLLENEDRARLHEIGSELGVRRRGFLRRGCLVVAAQVEIESIFLKRSVIFQFRALSSRRFQRGFDRFNMHRPASGSSTSSAAGASSAAASLPSPSSM